MSNEVLKDAQYFVIRDLKIKTTIRYYYTSIKITKTQNIDKPNAGKHAEQQKCSFTAGENEKMV